MKTGSWEHARARAETLKKQSRQQAEEYDRLARELNKSTGGSVDKKF